MQAICVFVLVVFGSRSISPVNKLFSGVSGPKLLIKLILYVLPLSIRIVGAGNKLLNKRVVNEIVSLFHVLVVASNVISAVKMVDDMLLGVHESIGGEDKPFIHVLNALISGIHIEM